MKNLTHIISGFVALFLLVSQAATADAVPGKPAPEFTLVDAADESHSLSDYEGQWLVLEWFNKDCPFVKKHYGSGNMQSLQKKYTGKGVKWLTIISSAKGMQGYLEPAEALAVAANTQLASSSPFLLDANGKVGKAYGAKTTPHMYIINPEGLVVYAGAIDDNDSASPAVIPKSTNYVAQALDEALADKAITTAATRPYGCSVKY